jgi:transaldolase/glucose-6-phosphate isomerase
MTPIESLWLASLGSGAPAAERILRSGSDAPVGGALIAWSDLAAASGRHPSAPALRRLLAHADWQTERAIEALAASVVRSLATELLPIHERTNGRLGRVAARLPPGLGADGLLEAAERLTRAVNRQNLIPGFPATEAGLEAAERSLIIGQPVLVGAAASLEALTHSLEACARGLRRRAERGLAPVGCLVAFDPEPVTAAVESDLAALGAGRAERAEAMRGKTLPALLQLALAQHAAALAEVPDPGQLGLLILAEGERLGVAAPRSVMVGLLAGEEVGDIPDPGLRQGLTGDWAMLSSARAHLDALAALGISVAELGRLADEQALILETDQLTRVAADEAAEARAMKAMLGDLSGEFPGVLQALQAGRVSAHLWRGDTTLWTQDPAEADEAARRLGWLLLPESMAGRVGEFEALRSQMMAEGYRHAVVLGMGGSSLAPDVFRRMLPAGRGLELHVLDSTDPEMVAALAGTIPVETTVFLVSSKSGTTTEPLALFEYFWAVAEPLLGAQTGKHFAAITDPGTPLQKLAQEHGFRASFAGPADVGGRYSALSAFGLVPAALLGADVRAMLAGGEAMARACGPTVEAAQHPGLQLGAFLGLGAEKGRDKLTFLSDGGCDPLEDWIEQLVAESSGKKGRGLLPVTHENPGAPEEYSADRLFVYLRRTGEFDAQAAALAGAGHPVMVLDVGPGEAGLGGEFLRWEFAVAVACHRLGISAFDQPDVQRAKDRTSDLLKSYRKQGALPMPHVLWQGQGVVAEGREGAPAIPGAAEIGAVQSAMLGTLHAGEALCFLAYLPMEPALEGEFQALRSALRGARRMATSLGFGPRYLHSTGQYHKGGPDRTAFILLSADRSAGVAVPGMGVSFNVLQRAQAIGDLQALLALGRRAWCFHFDSTERLAHWFAAFRAAAEAPPSG